MNEQKLFDKGIIISEIQMKTVKSGSKYALKYHEGNTFNFFTTKLDGSDTSAFAQFKNMGLKVGSTVTVGYLEDEFEFHGKQVISKKIINFRELNGQSTQTAPQGISGHTEHPGASQGCVPFDLGGAIFGGAVRVHMRVRSLLQQRRQAF